jgi:hypothetical protein
MRKTLATIACALIALVLSTNLGAADYAPDDEGYIRHWLMLAPIKLEQENNGAEEIDKQQIKEEAKIQPKEGDKTKVGDTELTWKAIKAADSFFDVNEILGSPTENSAGYFVAYVVLPNEKKDVQLLMGSNDQGKVYLNGKEVVKYDSTRSFDKDTDKAEGLTLNKGVNTIVFKVINENNNWQGSVRFATKDGTAIKDFKIALAPTAAAAK